MRAPATLVLAVVGGIAGVARAQTAQVWADAGHTVPYVMNFSLTFREYNAATRLPVTQSNGVIDPSEAAAITITISTTPAPTFNGTNPTTQAFWDPAVVGGHGSGWLWGIGSMFVDLVGDSNVGVAGANGQWQLSGGEVNSFGVLPAWRVGDASTFGTPLDGGSRLANIEAGQLGGDLFNLFTRDPVTNIWRGLWIPANYASRTVTFGIANNSAGVADASVLLADSTFPGNTIPLGANVGVSFGSISIPVGVPAPGAVGALLGAGVFAARRRRGAITR